MSLCLPRCAAALMLLAAAPFAGPASAFDGGSAGDAGPGYGAERRYSGAEGERAGAEGYRTGSERFGAAALTPQRRREALLRGDLGRTAPMIVFLAPPPLGTQGRAGYVAPFGVDDARAGVYPGGFGHSSGSIVYRGFDAPPAEAAELATPGGARIIDVEAVRLDNRLIGPGGIDVVRAGSAKIIRLSSGMQRRAAERHGPETRQAERRDTASLRPWSDAWRRYCRRAHPDFSAETGTYRGVDGQDVFCSGN